MFKLARRGMAAHKRRLIGLTSAVVVGVAFLVGTLILGDTMRSSFNDIFTQVNAGIDAVVTGDQTFGQETGQAPPAVPADLIPQIRDLEGVTDVQPVIQGFAALVGKDGKPVGGNGPPTFAGNWLDNATLSPERVVEGRAPEADGELVVDTGTKNTAGFALGDTVVLLTPKPTEFTLVGFTKYGDLDSLGGSTSASMTLADAERLLGKPGELSSILVQSDTDPDALTAQIDPLLPPGLIAQTGVELTETQNEQIQSGFLNFFTTFLLVFAGIAVLVATFSIYNTFAVIVAQKGRESALLRALGATRGQVLRSVAGESLLIGLLASAVGLVVGVGVAAGLIGLFRVIGIELPANGLTILPRSLVVGFIVGLIVTIIASLVPAIRASRVAPLAALREVAVETKTNITRRALIGGALMLVGLGLLAAPWYLEDNTIRYVGAGAFLTLIAFLVFGPVAARFVTRWLGWPVAKLRGVSGHMARANAVRNPKRTASTAAALMVGVAVVSMFTIFASSIKQVISDSVVGSLKAELTLSNSNFAGPGYDPALLGALRDLPEIAAVVGFDTQQAQLDGTVETITVTDVQALPQVAGFVGSTNPAEVSVDSELAAARNWQVGDTVAVEFSDGQQAQVTIGATFPKDDLFSGVMFPREIYSEFVGRQPIFQVFMKVSDGTSVEAAQTASQVVADEYFAGEVQTKEEFVQSVAGQIDQLLGVIYALLVLAIVIALMGIANTLSLSVFERTRELGLLRAVGQTRPQLRSMVRWESVIIAAFGTIGGIGLGVALGWALFASVARDESLTSTLAVPVGGLLAVGLVGGLVGVLAGWRPASRAAKLNVLDAIASE